MKLLVKVAGEVFEVEIDDLHARPVRAQIGAEVFEVWPELDGLTPGASAAPTPAPAHPRAHPTGPAPHPALGGNSVLSPLPGTLLSIAVQPGEDVTVGQPLCVIEAMKMNNTIRAARSGRIAAVRVTVGQTVSHRQVLLEYAAAEPEPA